jgi:hypothetical protein
MIKERVGQLAEFPDIQLQLYCKIRNIIQKNKMKYFLCSEIKLPLLFESSGEPNGCLL